MARPGVRFHIGYPVLARSVMGFYGSYFFVFIRAIVGAIWYGIQSFYGANLMSTCLKCIFGYKWDNWENKLPASADVTSKQLLCFFLVWILELPFVGSPCEHILFFGTDDNSASSILVTFARSSLSRVSSCLLQHSASSVGVWSTAVA